MGLECILVDNGYMQWWQSILKCFIMPIERFYSGLIASRGTDIGVLEVVECRSSR